MTGARMPAWYPAVGMGATRVEALSARRFEVMFDEHHDRVWRTLRRLGVPDADVDDATQRVFIVAARRLDEIRIGEEKAYLYGVALRTASEVRRRHPARRFVADEEAIASLVDDTEGADARLIAHETRAALDEALAAMPDDLRQVLVLVELEEVTVAELVQILAVPPGTVASRVRRAREAFALSARRVRARMKGLTS